jgi:hypothetical protein
MATGQLELSNVLSQTAVASLEDNDEEALLAEALTTRAVLFCRLNRQSEARVILEGARRIAERCGDFEGAGRALLVLVEEMYGDLDEPERRYISTRMAELLAHTQVASTRVRLEKCLKLMAMPNT